MELKQSDLAISPNRRVFFSFLYWQYHLQVYFNNERDDERVKLCVP